MVETNPTDHYQDVVRAVTYRGLTPRVFLIELQNNEGVLLRAFGTYKAAEAFAYNFQWEQGQPFPNYTIHEIEVQN